MITKRDIALGSTVHVAYRKENCINEQVVEMNLDQEDNVEFSIDGGVILKVPFSDIQDIFIKSEGRGLFCSSLVTGAGAFQICNLTPQEFSDLTRGRRFLVLVDADVYALEKREDSPGSAMEAYSNIFNALDSGRFDAVAGLTRQTNCYHFKEIR